MALYNESTVCSLCGEALDRPFMGLSYFIGTLPAEILGYGDSIMHIDCFDSWEHRMQFSREAFQDNLALLRKSGSSRGYVLLQSERYALICGPVVSHTVDLSLFEATVPSPYFSMVILRDWDLSLRTNWYDWNEFIEGGYKQMLKGLSSESAIEIDGIVDEIRHHIPDLESLWKHLKDQLPKSDPD